MFLSVIEDVQAFHAEPGLLGFDSVATLGIVIFKFHRSIVARSWLRGPDLFQRWIEPRLKSAIYESLAGARERGIAVRTLEVCLYGVYRSELVAVEDAFSSLYYMSGAN